MKKIFKIACLLISLAMFAGIVLVGGGAYFLYKSVVTPEFKKLNNIHRLEAQQHNDEALALCEELLREKPDYVNAQYARADLLVKMKRFDDAIAYCDEAAASQARPAFMLSRKASILETLKRYDEAMATYDDIIRSEPGYCQAYQARGDLLVRLKRYDEAVKVYDAGLLKTEGMT
jgi:tetratricopeptide (TPR) repeat protein